MTTSTRSQAIDDVLAEAVASGAVPNVVAIAADRDGIVYEGAAGPRAPGEDGAVGIDTPFRMYRPEFAEIQLLERLDGEQPVLRTPARKVTIKQLITHTSGLAYWFGNADLLGWEQAVGAPAAMTGLRAVLDAPLVAEPGSTFLYSNGADWLGPAGGVAGAIYTQILPFLAPGAMGMYRDFETALYASL